MPLMMRKGIHGNDEQESTDDNYQITKIINKSQDHQQISQRLSQTTQIHRESSIDSSYKTMSSGGSVTSAKNGISPFNLRSQCRGGEQCGGEYSVAFILASIHYSSFSCRV